MPYNAPKFRQIISKRRGVFMHKYSFVETERFKLTPSITKNQSKGLHITQSDELLKTTAKIYKTFKIPYKSIPKMGLCFLTWYKPFLLV